MRRHVIPTLLAVMLAGGTTAAMAQSTGPTGPAPSAGETSDRTPETKTETPLPQRDKTTPEPAGTPPSQQGATSDRTPEHHGTDGKAAPKASGSAASDTKGKTTAGDAYPPSGTRSE